MVKSFRPVFSAVVLALLSAAAVSARELADYKLGDRVEADLTTPVSLVVIDPEATALLKAREGERVPAIFRFYPEAGAEVTAAFHKSFVQTRVNFLDAVEQGFDARKLATHLLASEKFSRLIVSFQKKNPLFPVTTELARLWAGGESDQEFEAPLLAGLGNQMNAFIRATNATPPGAKVGATVRLVYYADPEISLTAQIAARHGTNHARTEFISFPRARTDLRASFPPEQQAVAKYLSSFLRTNCVLDADLTIALRAQRAEKMTVTESFTNGQVIAKKGQEVDRRVLAILAALNEKTPAKAAAVSLPPAIDSTTTSLTKYWVLGALGGGVLCLLLLVVLRRRRRAPGALLPVRQDNSSPALDADSQDWRQRAIAAERQAEKAQSVIRQGLVAQLARWMSESLVQKLLIQRAHLIATQQQAVTEVDRLGQRLETIHSRMQGRLSVYEQRIVELEKELDTKDEINRELIQAEITKIRRQMDAERVKGEGGLN